MRRRFKINFWTYPVEICEGNTQQITDFKRIFVIVTQEIPEELFEKKRGRILKGLSEKLLGIV